MKRTLAVAILLMGSVAWGQAPAVKLPSEARGAVGAFVEITGETSGAVVAWYVVDPGLSLFPPARLKDTKTAVVTSPRPGRYRLLAYSAVGQQPTIPAVCVVVIGDAPVPPPPPGPDPPPPPNDELVRDLQAAYDTDPAADKDANRTKLAALYRQAGSLADDQSITTAGALLSTLKTAAGTLLPRDALLPVRQRIAVLLRAELPTTAEAPLDSATRAKAKAVFSRVALALEVVR